MDPIRTQDPHNKTNATRSNEQTHRNKIHARHPHTRNKIHATRPTQQDPRNNIHSTTPTITRSTQQDPRLQNPRDKVHSTRSTQQDPRPQDPRNNNRNQSLVLAQQDPHNKIHATWQINKQGQQQDPHIANKITTPATTTVTITITTTRTITITITGISGISGRLDTGSAFASCRPACPAQQPERRTPAVAYGGALHAHYTICRVDVSHPYALPAVAMPNYVLVPIEPLVGVQQ